MREQLIQYVNLLFAGTSDSDEIREEILQNTLDRYDDLIEQGKSPEAAYRLAISGIGDINEILGSQPMTVPDAPNAQAPKTEDDPVRKKKRAGAIMLYILSAIPLIVLSELGASTLGLALTIIMVAAATYEMIITSKKDFDDDEDDDLDIEKTSFPPKKNDPNRQLKKSIHAVVDAITIAVYLIVSFSTKAWAITWIIFPISGCVNGLVNAIIDLKEANKHEI